MHTLSKNAGKPKIATRSCQLTPRYAAFFFFFFLYIYLISFINRWHTCCTDLCTSDRAYENCESLHVFVSVYLPIRCHGYIFDATCSSSRSAFSVESSWVMYENSFMGTLFVTDKCSGVPLITWAERPPTNLSSKTQRFDSTEAQQSRQQTLRRPHRRVITVITAWRIN